MTNASPLSQTSTPIEELLARQRAAFNAEGPVAYETRIDRLDRAIALVVDNQQVICEAVNADFGCRSKHVTLLTDIFTSVNTLKFAKKNLKQWMKPEKRRAPVPMNLFGARSVIHYQPKGVIGIMTPWNVPVNMIFSPLADILAAGNRAMIKPSEYTPRTSELMAELFARYFEPTEVAIVTGGPEVGAAFSAQKFDHLIFTGATSIGKLVMRAASENLVPVTLELGGKSPTIVSDSVDINDAAEKIIMGKSMNAGQLCISPDYCFVPASRMEAFITVCRETIARHFPRIVDNPDYVSMINERHFERIKGYLDDAQGKGARIEALNPANENWRESSANKIPLHLVVDPSDDMVCMQNEIFGPILNLKSYRNVDECINYINAQPRPLALYYFGKDKDEQQQVTDQTIAGGMTVNDVAMHYACDDLPFGGIGPSGMGNYHGFEGFKTFSHAKSVFKQGFVNLSKLAGTLPPYGDKLENMLAGQIKK